MSFDSPENWMDAELRRVPLPPRLLERLRAASELSDNDVDELLTDIPVPAELTAQLAEIVADEELDLRLCSIAVPEGLLDELSTIPYDDALRDVTVPANLLVELRRIAPRPWRWSPAQLAMAASLLLLLTSAYVSSVLGWMMSAYNSTQNITATVLSLPDPPVVLTSTVNLPVSITVEDDPARPDVLPTTIAVDDLLPSNVDVRTIDEQLDHILPAGYRLTDNILPLRYGILGQSAEATDRVADLEMFALADPRGVDAPVSAGFDRQFLVKHRTQPIVPLSASPDLRQQKLPLWRDTASFEQLRKRAAAGRLPAAHEIHVEDFLAAMDCQFLPAAPGRLAIRSFAGPSVFGDEEASLLQIGVQAGPLVRTSAVHVTMVIDTSDSMRWSDRLERARVALRRFTAQMAPGDRLSVVVYSDVADTLVEDAGVEDMTTIFDAIDALSAHGGSNFGAGLQTAAMAAESPAAVAIGRRRIMLLTDSLPRLPAVAREQIDKLVGELVAAEIAIDVVDIDAADSDDEALAALATQCGSKLIVARDTAALVPQLVARATGMSPEIASYASVEITFNPKAVKAYRLLGHEAIAIGGTPAKIESSLLAGESAMVLFEVWLHASVPDDVASVVVNWRDAGGDMQTERQQVGQRQFERSFAASALPLQAAAIAAEAAEVLRESPFTAARNRDLRPVLAVAAQVNERLSQRPAYRRFVAALEQAQRASRTGDAP